MIKAGADLDYIETNYQTTLDSNKTVHKAGGGNENSGDRFELKLSSEDCINRVYVWGSHQHLRGIQFDFDSGSSKSQT